MRLGSKPGLRDSPTIQPPPPNTGPGSHPASMGTGPRGRVRPPGEARLHAHRAAPISSLGPQRAFIPPRPKVPTTGSAPPCEGAQKPGYNLGCRSRALQAQGFGVKSPFQTLVHSFPYCTTVPGYPEDIKCRGYYIEVTVFLLVKYNNNKTKGVQPS